MLGMAGTVLALLFAGTCAHAAPFPQDKLPPVLQPWSDWVLHQDEAINCPLVWGQNEKRECVWPSELHLQATAAGAEFVLTGQLDKKDWLILPGSARYWPQHVTNSGKDSSVMRHNQSPALLLDPGVFRIEGEFEWKRIPDSIPVTPGVGRIELVVNDRHIPAPEYTRNQLQLRQTEQRSEDAQSGVAFQIYRHLEDRIPQILTTLIKVRVSGNEREIVTARVLPEGFTALDMQSEVPARLEDDGRLRLLARAGEYEITIQARNTAVSDAIQVFSRPPPSGPWAEDEIWSVERRGELRSITISGAPILDPAQTDIPAQWKHLPTYLMDSEAALKFTQEERGLQTSSADRIRVKRDMWLDFSAAGYSVRDIITGTLHTRTRLNSTAELELGRAHLNGEEQFITRLGDKGAAGIEVRQQHLNLHAESRLNPQNIASVPALGWEFNPIALHTELNLPPGWRMLAAFGADSVSNTWVQQWSLLDLFVVLLLSIGFARMWGWKYGIFALLGLILTYQEPNAPRFIWLHLLGSAALLRVAPQGRLQRVVRIYLGGAALTMAVLLLVFSAQQIRSAVYPQLEIVSGSHSPHPQQKRNIVRSDMGMEQARTGGAKMLSAVAADNMTKAAPPRVIHSSYSTSLETQTGAGIPTWNWRKISFDFNTSVAPGKRMKFIFSSPWMTRTGLVAGVLLALYMFGRICFALKPGKDSADTDTYLQGGAPNTAVLIAGIFAGTLALICASSPAQAQDAQTMEREHHATEVEGSSTIPSMEMLEELRRRLTQAPDCAPDCAALQRVQVEISQGELRIEQQIHSAVLSAVPLAFPLEQLVPATVTARTGSDTDLHPILMRTPQDQPHAQLWARVENGTTTLSLSASIPTGTTQVEIPLPLRAGDIRITAEGWDVINQTENPANTSTISLRRASEAQLKEPDTAELPLYAEVRRHLDLGVEWRLETTLKRMSSKGNAGVIRIPLLEGEQIVSEGIETRAGDALIELGPETETVRWESRLEMQSPIELKSGKAAHFTEIWQLQLSPLWHAHFSGTPLIHTYQNGHWLAQWHPRARENLLLHVERPQGAPGQHITVENCTLKHKRGEQRSETNLRLNIRSSVATRHTIVLPSTDVEVEQVRRNGTEIRIEQEGTQLSLPLQKGTQNLDIIWNQEHPLGIFSTTPELNLNAPGANIGLNLTLPQTRWVLFAGGPLMGPAVLFWGIVLVLGVVALLLGRFAPTPLRWWHWFILGAGLSQAPLPALLLVSLWLILLGVRKKYAGRIQHALAFNTIQLGLGILSICALLALIAAVQQGLLGMPEMQVAGQNSGAWDLHWYQDRSSAELPTAWVVSVPLLVYRALMLIWALWLALALLHWLRWGWGCLSAGELWRTLPRRVRTSKTGTADTAATTQHKRSGKDS